MIRHRPRSSYCKAISVREARTTSRIVPVCTAISCNFISSFCLDCSGCHRLRNFANSLTTFQLLHPFPSHSTQTKRKKSPAHHTRNQHSAGEHQPQMHFLHHQHRTSAPPGAPGVPALRGRMPSVSPALVSLEMEMGDGIFGEEGGCGLARGGGGGWRGGREEGKEGVERNVRQHANALGQGIGGGGGS